MKANEIVQKAKEFNNLTSDRALAKMLGVSDVTVLSWRHGTHLPTPEHAQHLAELAGIDPAPFVAEMLIQSTKDKGLRQTLDRFKRALAAAAGVIPALLVAVHQCILCKIEGSTRFQPVAG